MIRPCTNADFDAIFGFLVAFLLSLASPLACPPLYAQNYAVISDNQLVLDNSLIRRQVQFSKEEGKVYSTSLMVRGDGTELLSPNSAEFSFAVDGKFYSGQQLWKALSCSPAQDDLQGRGATLKLACVANPALEIELTYLAYPALPVIRKKLCFTNAGKKDIKIESVDVEDLFLRFTFPECWVMSNYGRQKRLWPYVGNWDDSAVVVHHTTTRSGLLLGNEVPGVLKRTAFTDPRSRITIGTTHTDQDFVFRKWLRPGERWTAPRVFVIPYRRSDDPADVLNGALGDFVRKHMGIRLARLSPKPVLMYNMGDPSAEQASERMARGLADLAATCGMEVFVIDAGWHINKNQGRARASWVEACGDWIVNPDEFPGGLKPVFDHVRSKGLTPGLWVSLATSNPTAQMYADHPEWRVIGHDGQPANLHYAGLPMKTECLCTGYYDYIQGVLLRAVRDYGLGYVKLDISMVSSAYIDDPKVSGCYARNHPLHRDHEESLIMIYERCFKLFDELHTAAPNLFIDCTFETDGKLQLIDYAFVQHAEGNWLSNVEPAFPTGGLRVRDIAWARSPALPSGAFLVGNLNLDDAHYEYNIKCQLGSMPLFICDLRKVNRAHLPVIAQWAQWTRKMQARYDFIMYRQDLPGYGAPREGFWDGWARINTDAKSGGVVGLFRHGSGERTRQVFIRGLAPQDDYVVRKAPGGEEIARASGAALAENGFSVTIAHKYDGEILEIEGRK